MPLVIVGDRGGGGFSGSVFAAVEASHLVVDDTFELDDDGSLFGSGDLLVKSDGDTLSLAVVGDIGGLPLLLRLCVVNLDLGIVHLELEGVEDNLFGRLDDFGLDAVKDILSISNYEKEDAEQMKLLKLPQLKLSTYVTVPLYVQALKSRSRKDKT